MSRLDQIFELLKLKPLQSSHCGEDFVSAVLIVAEFTQDQEMIDACHAKFDAMGASPDYPGNAVLVPDVVGSLSPYRSIAHVPQL